MSLILPESVVREQQVDRQIGAARWLDGALRHLDRRLSLSWGLEGATDPDIVPGRWHVRIDLSEAGVPPAYVPITTPEGGYREPDAGVLEELQARDMRRRDNDVDAQIAKRHRREDALNYRAAEKRGETKENVYYQVKGEIEPGTLVSNIPWTKSAKAKRPK